MEAMQENPYLPVAAPILDIYPETKMEKTYRIQARVSANFGQFLEVSLPGYGEAPISLSNVKNLSHYTPIMGNVGNNTK